MKINREDLPIAKWELIGPPLARVFLGNRDIQRRVSTSVVQRYAEDMRAGHWLATGDPIKIGKSGALLDGQQRCEAICLANVEICCLVLYGVDDAAQIAMDIGKVRSFADRVEIAQVPSMNRVLATVLNTLARMYGSKMNNTNVNDYVKLEALEALRASLEFAGGMRKLRCVTQRAYVLGAIAAARHVLGATAEPRLRRFGAILNGLMPDDPDDAPAHVTRNVLIERTGGTGARAIRELYLKTQRGIQAFMERDRIARIYAPQGFIYDLSDLFLVEERPDA